MGMKSRINAMSPDEFRKEAERLSQYFDLRGCETKECINKRIMSKNSANLNRVREVPSLRGVMRAQRLIRYKVLFK